MSGSSPAFVTLLNMVPSNKRVSSPVLQAGNAGFESGCRRLFHPMIPQRCIYNQSVRIFTVISSENYRIFFPPPIVECATVGKLYLIKAFVLSEMYRFLGVYQDKTDVIIKGGKS